MGIFDVFQLVASNVWVYGGAFLLVLSILVFVHEWGHYIIARLCGVRVEQFSIGFGPELFGFTDGHKTRWKFSLIPLGGYVKMFGDTDPASATHDDNVEGEEGEIRPMTSAERNEAFFAKPVWKRAAIVFAGPAINYIFAIILMTALFATHGKPVTPAIAGAIIVGSAADKAGFQPHDLVLTIDGKNVESFDDVRREMVIGLDTERHFVIERDGVQMDLYPTPEREELEDRFGFKHTRGMLGMVSAQGAVPISVIDKVDGQAIKKPRDYIFNNGGKNITLDINYGDDDETQSDDSDRTQYIIRPPKAANKDLSVKDSINHDIVFLYENDADIIKKYGIIGSARESVREAYNLTAGTLSAIGQIIVGTRSTKELGGLPRIGAVAGDMAKQGVVALIMFTALLSVNLGLINLFPIPVLDGGHLVFYALETVLRRPIPEKVQDYAFRAGFVFLIGVMVYANLNDILQLIL